MTIITNTNNEKVPTRLKNVYDLILEKDKGNSKIHRLRIINIYKADFNLLLKNYWQQQKECTQQ